jgi:hypothetical protein
MSQTKVEAPFVANNANFRNLIINGDMNISQRATSETGVTSSGYYNIDRWRTDNINAGTWTISQSTTVPTGQGFFNSQKFDCTTADGSLASADRLLCQQRIEDQFCTFLKKGTSSALSVTVSFWVRSNKTGTYICEIYDSQNSRHINKSYTIDSADTWEKKTIVFPGDTTGAFANDNGVGLMLGFWLAAGTDYTSGTLATAWQANDATDRAVGQVNLADSTSNEWYLTGVQLEVGDQATDFEHLPFDVQLRRCHRYFQKIQMASNTVINSMAYGSTAIYTGIPHPDGTMRTSPTVTLPTAGKTSGTVAFVTAVGAYPTTVGTNTVDNVTANYFRVIGASYSANFVAGYAVGFYSNGTNNILIDAEL